MWVVAMRPFSTYRLCTVVPSMFYIHWSHWIGFCPASWRRCGFLRRKGGDKGGDKWREWNGRGRGLLVNIIHKNALLLRSVTHIWSRLRGLTRQQLAGAEASYQENVQTHMYKLWRGEEHQIECRCAACILSEASLRIWALFRNTVITSAQCLEIWCRKSGN